MTWSQFRKGQALRRERNKVGPARWISQLKTFLCPQNENKLLHVTRLIKTAIHVFAYCSGGIKKSTLTEDSVPTLSAPCTTLLQSLLGTVRHGNSLIKAKIANERAALKWCWSTEDWKFYERKAKDHR